MVIDDYFTFLFNLFLFKKSYLPLVDLYAFLFYFILFYRHYKLVGLYAYVRGLSFAVLILCFSIYYILLFLDWI